MAGKLVILMISWGLLFASFLDAQVRQPGFFWNTDFNTGVYFQSWSKTDDRISQFSIPVNYLLPVNRKLNLDVTTGLAFADRATALNSLNGLIDTRFRLTYLTLKEKLLLSTYVTFPSGISRLEGDQNEVASALSDDALDFRVPNYGHGLHVNVAAAYAQEISQGLVLGLGMAFLQKNAFKPFMDNELEYRPGNEVAGTLGLDIGGKKLKMTADASYIFYQADKANDVEIFKSGNKLFLHFRWLYSSRPFGLTIYLRNRSKGKNERGIELLEKEILNSNGNQLDIGTVASYAIGHKTILKGLFGTKIYAKNEYGEKGALIFSIGGGIKRLVFRKLSLEGSARLSKGRLRKTDTSTGITGVELGGSIRFLL